MSRYYNFPDFIDDVIAEADQVSKTNSHCGIDELFLVRRASIEYCIKLINSRWAIFLIIVSLIWESAFELAFTMFKRTLSWHLVQRILGVSAEDKLRQLKNDRRFPLALKEIADKYKGQWKKLDGNRVEIDRLCRNAATDLYKKGLLFNY